MCYRTQQLYHCGCRPTTYQTLVLSNDFSACRAPFVYPRHMRTMCDIHFYQQKRMGAPLYVLVPQTPVGPPSTTNVRNETGRNPGWSPIRSPSASTEEPRNRGTADLAVRPKPKGMAIQDVIHGVNEELSVQFRKLMSAARRAPGRTAMENYSQHGPRKRQARELEPEESQPALEL